MKQSLYTVSNNSSLMPLNKALAICSFQLQLMPSVYGAPRTTQNHRERARPAFIRGLMPEAHAFYTLLLVSRVQPTDNTRATLIHTLHTVFICWTPRAHRQTQTHYRRGCTWVALSVGDRENTWRSRSTHVADRFLVAWIEI